MSLFPSKFPSKGLVVGVAPERACLVVRAGDGQRVVAEVEGAFTDGRQHETLLHRLLQKAPARSPPVHLVLCDSLARFGVVPPVPGNPYLDRESFTEIARSRLAHLYGDMADWQCAIDRPRWNQSVLACAIPAPWRAAMTALDRMHRYRFQRCTPGFVQAWNRLGVPAAKEPVVFVLLDEGHLTLGVHRSGPNATGWSHLRQVRHAAVDGVNEVVAQELALAGEASIQRQLLVSLIPLTPTVRSTPQCTLVDLSQGGRLSRTQALASLGGS